jgi:anti-sigma regulatory factor (Ser/Thr protein kinase)
MALGGRFEFVVVDDASAGRRLRADLTRWLHAAGVNGTTGYEIVSAVSEAYANAVEHPVDRASRQVAIEGEFRGHEVVFRVSDQGRWDETRDPSRGHYGYRLMEAQMDSVEVERSRSGTVVTLRRTV